MGNFDLPQKERKKVELVHDWLSFTFDDLDYEEYEDQYRNRHYTIPFTNSNDDVMARLFFLLGERTKYWMSYPCENRALNNYRFGYIIGEHIKINCCGPENDRKRKTTQILMSGQACREFEEYQNGDWFEFLPYLYKNLRGNFRRIDITFDIFDREILDIYRLEKFVRKGHWSGTTRKWHFDESGERGAKAELNTSAGFTFTLGSPGATQVQFYDKNLERKAKKQLDKGTDTWYRIEMRFVGDKANAVVREYIKLAEIKDKEERNRKVAIFFKSCLVELVDFKEENSTGNKNIRKWNRDKAWDKFLGQLDDNLNIACDPKTKRSIKQKEEWVDRSVATTLAQFLICYDSLYEGRFDEEMRRKAGESIKHLSNTQKEAVNRWLKDNGLKKLKDNDWYDWQCRFREI